MTASYVPSRTDNIQEARLAQRGTTQGHHAGLSKASPTRYPVRWVPCPVLGPSGALCRDNIGMRRPIGPLRASFRTPGPALGARAAWGPSALRGFGSPLRGTVHRGGPRPGSLPRPTGSCRRPSLRRRPGPPPGSLRATPGPARPGQGTWFAWSPSHRSVAPPGPLRYSRAPCVPLAPSAWVGPPGRPPLVTAGRSVPSLRRLGGASGSAPPRGGPLAAPPTAGPLSKAPGPPRL